MASLVRVPYSEGLLVHSRADRFGLFFRRCVFGLVAGSVAAGALGLPSSAAPPTTPYLSEIHYDNTGTDTGEAVEVAGPAGTDLTGWSIVLYNGSGGASYDTDPLSGLITDQQGGFGTVVGSSFGSATESGARARVVVTRVPVEQPPISTVSMTGIQTPRARFGDFMNSTIGL